MTQTTERCVAEQLELPDIICRNHEFRLLDQNILYQKGSIDLTSETPTVNNDYRVRCKLCGKIERWSIYKACPKCWHAMNLPDGEPTWEAQYPVQGVRLGWQILEAICTNNACDFSYAFVRSTLMVSPKGY